MSVESVDIEWADNSDMILAYTMHINGTAIRFEHVPEGFGFVVTDMQDFALPVFLVKDEA